MLSVWETIKERRSIRKFSAKDVDDSLLEQVLEAARLAPSASNRQPWRFLVIKDRTIKEKICHICLDQHFIEEAPAVIICFGDLERYSVESKKKRWQEFVDSGVASTLSGRFSEPDFISSRNSLSSPREQLITPVIANCYIAIEHLLLMATALGLGTCWVGGFEDPTEFNRLFSLADTLIPVAVVPIGYSAGKSRLSKRPRIALNEILIKPTIK